MRRRFLVAYDYGQGALWAYLLADSVEQIKGRHPELAVLDEPPDWMTPAELEKLRTIDIDRVEGTWLATPPGAS